MSGALRTARETVAGLLVLDAVTVYDHEPPLVSNGASVTVSSVGVTATEWTLAVRVYVTGMQPSDAQNLLDDTVLLVDGLLTAPRADWTFEFDEGRTVFVATTVIQVPREDF